METVINKRNRNALLLLFLVVFYMFFYHVARSLPWHESGVIGGKNYNLIVYVSSLIAAFVTSFVLQFLISLVTIRSPYSAKGIISFISLITVPASFVFLWSVYQNEASTPAADMIKSHFLREHLPHSVVVLIMTLLIAGTFLIVLRETDCAKNRKQQLVRICVAFQAAFICGILNYGPNTFKNGLWGIFHNHAYTASIISVMSGAPFDAVNTNIYGHYGILYAPFVWLLGHDYRAIALTIALFSSLICLCAFLCTSKLVSDPVIYYVSVIAIASINVTYYKPGQALAVMPHRYLFPLLGLTYLICLREKIRNKNLRSIIEYVIGSLGIVFNIETGIGTAMALASVRLFDIKKNDVCDTSAKPFAFLVIIRVIHQIFYVLICFITAWAIVDVYNIAVGGDLLPLSLFVYPYGSKDYVISKELTLPIPTTKASYMLHIVVFSYAVFSALYEFTQKTKSSLGRVDSSPNEYIVFDHKKISSLAIGVSGLVSLSYYMNRTALGQISICHIHFVILLAVYSEVWTHIKPNLKGFINPRHFLSYGTLPMKVGLSAAAFYLVSWFAFEGVFSLGGAIETRINTIWDVQSLSTSLEEYKEKVPDSLVAFGIGMPEIEYCVGRTPKLILSEWSNTNRYSEQYVLDYLKTCDSFAVTEGTRLKIPDSFTPAETVSTDEFSIIIYCRE